MEFRRRAPAVGSAVRRLRSQNDGGPVEPGEGAVANSTGPPEQGRRGGDGGAAGLARRRGIRG